MIAFTISQSFSISALDSDPARRRPTPTPLYCIAKLKVVPLLSPRPTPNSTSGCSQDPVPFVAGPPFGTPLMRKRQARRRRHRNS